MTTIPNSERPRRDLSPQSEGGWVRPLLLGVLGVSLLFLVMPRATGRPPADKPGDPAVRHAPKGAKPSGGTQRTSSLGPVDSRLALGQSLPEPVPAEVWPTGQPGESPEQPSEPEPHLWELEALVSQVKNMKVITAEEATDLKRLLRELRQQGAAAVPAIGEFLRQGEDVDFTKMSGGELAGHRTLRQALLNTLQQIGGNAALAVALEQLQQTREPIEVALVARTLDQAEPGVHREEVIQAVSNALQWAEQAPPKEGPDVGPLFKLLQTYGGKQTVAVLDHAVSQWGEYALIALAGLPDGEGLPSLLAVVGTPSVAVQNPALPFQILAQAPVRYPAAGEALVDLARTGRIPDWAWGEVGEVLGGKQLQFSRKMFEGTPLAGKDASGAGGGAWLARDYYIQWLNVRYEQHLVSADWSAEQIEQQLALINQLLGVTSRPAAVQALQQARKSLLGGSQ